MKYILITLLLVATTAQAKTFSMADYAATTGKIPPQRVAKNTNSYTDKVEATQAAIIKKEAKIVRLRGRIGIVGTQYSEQLAKLSLMEGDTTPGRKAAATDRTTRLFAINNEIVKAGKRLGELREVLAYYKRCVEVEKMGEKLRGRRLISFSC